MRTYKIGPPDPDICKRLRVNNIVEYIQLYEKKWLDHLEPMDGSRLWISRLAFQYQPPNSGTAGHRKTKTKMERPRTPRTLKEQVPKP
jgi:hypothetical protein